MNPLQKKNEKALDRIEKKRERELVRNYQLALKELRGKIATLYEKTDGDWNKAQKYNRLSKLEKEIAREIGKLTGKNAQTLKKSQLDLYEESYYRTAHVLSNEVKSDLGFALLDKDLVEEAIDNPLDRVGFLQRNRDNQQQLTRQIREQLTQSLVQGEAYGKAAQRVKKRMDVGASKAMTIAQTENHRVRNKARLDSMAEGEKAGITLKKQWLATVDGDTRSSHQDLDGVQIDIDKDFEGEEGSGPAPGSLGSASEDIHCRCTMLEVVVGFEPNQRRVKGEGITEYGSFNEFKEKLS